MIPDESKPKTLDNAAKPHLNETSPLSQDYPIVSSRRFLCPATTATPPATQLTNTCTGDIGDSGPELPQHPASAYPNVASAGSPTTTTTGCYDACCWQPTIEAHN